MKSHLRWTSRQLLATTLLVSGVLPLAMPVLADGTAAGTQISNTATAKYEDPTNPGVQIDATSNRVDVTVAEVAGVTVTPLAITDTNGGTVLPSDTVNYDYRITNVGNDPTQLFIPGSATVTGPGTAGTLQISTNGGTSFTDVPAAGLTTSSIPAGSSVIVRVSVIVNALAPSGAPISVRLGDTGPNDNSATTQNQPDATDGATAAEVRTVDNLNGAVTGEAAGSPTNGEREASAVQQILVGSQPQAFATVLKTHTNYSDNSTPNTLTDDVLTYGLSLRVESTAPAGSSGLSPAALAGITVNGIGPNRVLVSDAIPAGTALSGAATSTDPKWIPVYTSEPLSTPATAATWSTTPSGTVTRVGFVYDAGANGALPAGTTVNGFVFKVIASGVVGTQTIANVAQLFGQTQGNIGPTAPLVYDESGDQNPSNYNDNGTPGPTSSLTPTSSAASIPNGVANPTADGVDSNNDNTGNGPGGEDNVYTIAALGTVLNGPNGRPDAVGPTDNNDDFTERSSPVPANTAPNSTIDPGSVTFSNTISNPTTSPLTSILLVPDAASFVAAAGETLPPSGTKVTLSYGGQTATYNFNGTNFVFESGSTIVIPTLAPGQSVNYSVAVDLPANTPLSTDTSKGFAVPIYAFKDVDGNARPGSIAAEPSQNRTIARVYTGFLKLVKEARILDASGTPVSGPGGVFSTTPPASDIKPGNQIEYRITYTNISIAPVGAGNVTLSATNIAITEDGTATPNNWAKDNDNNGVIDTSHVVGGATASYGNTTYFPSGEQSGNSATTDVTKYVHAPGVVIQPQASGFFSFRRVIK